MQTREVSAKKFDALKKKSIVLNACPCCPNFGAEIIIPMTAYGCKTRSVYVRCKYCGYETKNYNAATPFDDTENKRYGSFVIDKSLMNAIHSAVNDWNGRSGNEKQKMP